MDIIEAIKNRNAPFLIAELGVNYYDIAIASQIDLMEAAKKMVDEAKEAGCDAVKFQSYTAETIASINSPAYWDRSKESIGSQFALFKKFDKFGEEEYKELHDHCCKREILFCSTPFDYKAVDYLEPLMSFYKISSSDLNNIPFIRYIASKNKPIFLSTGASTIEEIEFALNIIKQAGIDKICLMHCVLSYPTLNENANLEMIKSLKIKFPEYLAGYSDHTVPDEDMLILTVAYLYGSQVIEKHFTLNKELQGNDHYHAADPDDFRKFKRNIELINKINGSSFKAVLECENDSRKFARRSVVANCSLRKGLVVDKSHLVCKRPGYGIPPSELDELIGCKSLCDIDIDSILEWDMFERPEH